MVTFPDWSWVCAICFLWHGPEESLGSAGVISEGMCDDRELVLQQVTQDEKKGKQIRGVSAFAAKLSTLHSKGDQQKHLRKQIRVSQTDIE